jgi:CO dehydrogenase maturation factor
MDDLIEERTGVKPGTGGAMFKLNPRVDDIPERFAVHHNGISLLRMGTVKKGGAGCYCPENAFLQSLISHLFLSERDVMIVDMEAGVEHLGRATVRGVDWLIIVVEASRQSTDTARRIQSMSSDLGLKLVGVVGNQCRDENDRKYIVEAVAPIPVLGILPYDDTLRRAEVEGYPPDLNLPLVASGISEIITKIEQKTGQ